VHSQNIAHATLGAGGILIHEDHVLLVQLNYGKAKGAWILPGGMVEQGEHPEETAVRETKEETGIDTRVMSLVAVRHRKQEMGKANLYQVFELALQRSEPISNLSLSWDPTELICAQFWEVQKALHSEDVRPLTRMFIQMALESSQRLAQISHPYIQDTDDSGFGG
tara:strand:- start:2703 stop:3200 length:498 start_codon:yes stop_codon:yes gene_type:complete